MDGIDTDMLRATDRYFTKLLDNLDRHDRAGRNVPRQQTPEQGRPRSMLGRTDGDLV